MYQLCWCRYSFFDTLSLAINCFMQIFKAALKGDHLIENLTIYLPFHFFFKIQLLKYETEMMFTDL